jgi:hypothetical protein
VWSASNIKVLACQTDARGSFDPQRLSGALANHLPPAPSRIRLFPLQKAFVGLPALTTADNIKPPKLRQ